MKSGKQLPLGNNNFIALRNSNQIYIDKTDMVYNMAITRYKLFISLPQGFGKSLLLSTFETLFRDGLKYFDGLKISHLWNEKQYKVLKLDFSKITDFTTIEEFTAKFRVFLEQSFQECKIDFHIRDNEEANWEFCRFLCEQDINSFVLLIDEYDAPLNAHRHQPELFEAVLRKLLHFYSIVKSEDGPFRFIFMTSVNPFSISDILREFNVMSDISQDLKFEAILGYTKEEILHYFGEYVEQAAKVNKMEISQLMDTMLEKYGGFVFYDWAGYPEKIATHVCNSLSVLNFLNNPQNGF